MTPKIPLKLTYRGLFLSFLMFNIIFIGFFIYRPVLAYICGTQHNDPPFLENERITYDSEGFLIFKFKPKITFQITWNFDPNCFPNYVQGHQPFTILANPANRGFWATAIQTNNILYFYNNNNCDLTETYVAGQEYTTYLPIYGQTIYKYNTWEEIKTKLFTIDDVSTTTEYAFEGFINGIYYCYELEFENLPQIEITYPPNNSQVAGKIDFQINYANLAGYNRLMMILEDWDASSTCPEYGDENWIEEYNLYFNYQTKPFFSPFLTENDGTTTIAVSGIPPHKYKCVRCYAINENTGAMTRNLCPTYSIETLFYEPEIEPPHFYVPFKSWTNFYGEHSEKWTTSTELFNKLANYVNPIMEKIGDLSFTFSKIFDATTSAQKGMEYGQAIGKITGYTKIIDNFFGSNLGTIIVSVFSFYIITAISLVVFKLIKNLIDLLKP